MREQYTNRNFARKYERQYLWKRYYGASVGVKYSELWCHGRSKNTIRRCQPSNILVYTLIKSQDNWVLTKKYIISVISVIGGTTEQATSKSLNEIKGLKDKILLKPKLCLNNP